MTTQRTAYNSVMNEGGEGFVPSGTVVDARAEEEALLAEERALLKRTEGRAAYGDLSAMVADATIKTRIGALEHRLAA